MQYITSGLFSSQFIRSISIFFIGLLQSFTGQPIAHRWKVGDKMRVGGRAGQKPVRGQGSDAHNRRETIEGLFKNPPMLLAGLSKLLFNIGKANAKMPKTIDASKSTGFVRSIPVAVFTSVEASIRAHLDMLDMSLKEEGWNVDYCGRINKGKLEMVSANLHQVPVWFKLDLQHNLPAKARKERVDLGTYNTHPLATLSAIMLNPNWLKSLGKIIDGVKVGGADIVTLVLPGLTQMFCPTVSHQAKATLHCIAIQVNPAMKRVHIGLRPVNAIPCGSMLIPLVVPS